MTSFNVLSPLDRAAAEPGLQPALEANQDTLSPNRNLAPSARDLMRSGGWKWAVVA